MDAWGLNTDSLQEDPWDYVHMTTWNFLPFLLKRVGVAPAWAVRIVFAVWFAATRGICRGLRASPLRHSKQFTPSLRARFTLTTMQTAYIGMGANLPSPAGPPAATLAAAVARLAILRPRRCRSSLYSTAPVGFADQPRFTQRRRRPRNRTFPAYPARATCLIIERGYRS